MIAPEPAKEMARGFGLARCAEGVLTDRARDRGPAPDGTPRGSFGPSLAGEPQPDSNLPLTPIECQEGQVAPLRVKEKRIRKVPQLGSLHISGCNDPVEFFGEWPVGIDPGQPGEQGCGCLFLHSLPREDRAQLGFEEVR